MKKLCVQDNVPLTPFFLSFPDLGPSPSRSLIGLDTVHNAQFKTKIVLVSDSI